MKIRDGGNHTFLPVISSSFPSPPNLSRGVAYSQCEYKEQIPDLDHITGKGVPLQIPRVPANFTEHQSTHLDRQLLLLEVPQSIFSILAIRRQSKGASFRPAAEAKAYSVSSSKVTHKIHACPDEPCCQILLNMT